MHTGTKGKMAWSDMLGATARGKQRESYVCRLIHSWTQPWYA